MGIIMPKVNQQYVAEKESSIVDAAIRVCKSKPAYAVTLRDVVKESGISQGGMYHYFQDIDQIFAKILDRCFNEIRIAEEDYRIFESSMPPREIILEAFNALGQLIDEIANQYGSLINQLNTIFLHDPDRGMKVLGQSSNHRDAIDYYGRIFSFIEAHAAKGDFELSVPMEHLLLLADMAMLAAQHVSTFSQKYFNKMAIGLGANNEYTTAKDMMNVLAISIIQLLVDGKN